MGDSFPKFLGVLLACALVAALGLLSYSQYRIVRAVDSVERRLANVQPTPAQRPPLPPLPSEPIELGPSAALGRTDAPVVLMEFSDFECPFCARFSAETLPTIRRDYVDRGLLRLVYRQMPLTQIHPSAQAAATASICAREQGRFWEMHDALYAQSSDLNPREFGAMAASAGLDQAQFERCYDEGRSDEISSDLASARELGVTGTPTLFLGRGLPDGRMLLVRRLTGAVSAQQLAQEIDELLAAGRVSQRRLPSAPLL